MVINTGPIYYLEQCCNGITNRENASIYQFLQEENRQMKINFKTQKKYGINKFNGWAGFEKETRVAIVT